MNFYIFDRKYMNENSTRVYNIPELDSEILWRV